MTYYNGSFQWKDDTSIDLFLIENNLCQNTTYSTMNGTVYFSINVSQNCWEYTTNSRRKHINLCGPIMNDPAFYHGIIILLILPIVIFCINLILTAFMIKHLCIKEHNWIKQPSQSVKVTSIMLSITMLIFSGLSITFSSLKMHGYNKYGILKESLHYANYPGTVFHSETYIAYIIFVFYLLYNIMIYVHVCPTFSEFCVKCKFIQETKPMQII